MTSSSQIRSEIGPLILALARAWRREGDKALAQHGLSWATAIPLSVLSRRGKSVRQGVLAEEMGIEGPSLVRLIDLLQGDELVVRREDGGDRRAKTLHLTPRGEAKAEEINRVLRRVRASLLKNIDEEALATTFETLQQIVRQADSLEQVNAEAAP